jgi:hypothetical protein
VSGWPRSFAPGEPDCRHAARIGRDGEAGWPPSSVRGDSRSGSPGEAFVSREDGRPAGLGGQQAELDRGGLRGEQGDAIAKRGGDEQDAVFVHPVVPGEGVDGAGAPADDDICDPSGSSMMPSRVEKARTMV